MKRLLIGLAALVVVPVSTGCNAPAVSRVTGSDASFQKDMDDYCTARLNGQNERQRSKLSNEEKKSDDEATKNITTTETAFFSRKLHICVDVYKSQDSKDPKDFLYTISDLTNGFLTEPEWIAYDGNGNDQPMVLASDQGSYRHAHAEGYWKSVDSNGVDQVNKVKIDCDLDGRRPPGDDANNCEKIEGYLATATGTPDTDKQTYHVVSWTPDEIIATDVERGLTGSTSTTLIIQPKTKNVETFDTTQMDERQPDLFKGVAGKNYKDHYVLSGGMYMKFGADTFFQCDERGVVTDMSLDRAQEHHGDLAKVKEDEWNLAKQRPKAHHKFTTAECNSAMQTKLDALR